MDKNKKVNNDLESMTDDEIIEKLLCENELPTKTVFMKRLEIPVKLKALTAKQVSKLRDQCTSTDKVKGREIRKFDNDAFNMGLIVKATVSPNWNSSKLLNGLKVSSGEEVIKRKLLAGELDSLGDEVLDLSGFNDELKDIETIKNSSSPDTNLA
ncbi:hypothetical protein D9O40_00715 [Clostridium autoethanogenum]|uniref:XkdN-like protein n=1 Tax=Clostridium autoethanogenum TaxID=84023 RepID=A0A3M0T3T6_9CLOT|nr:hypothetical protein [Clostridium autoethanogenum]RMD04905.1 hypothetical protein D9O40_00715 [Clostridium autoethanogenum]